MTLQRPLDLNRKEFRAFKAKALRFRVHEQTLLRRATKNAPETKVIDDPAERLEVMKEMHDELGHKGREATYRKVADRY